MARRRVYKVYGGMGTGITIDDEAGPFLQAAADSAPLEFARAARHVAYTMQNDIKTGISIGSLRGISIPKRKTLTGDARRRFMARGRKPGKRSKRKTIFKTKSRMYHLRESMRFEGGVKKNPKKGKSVKNAIGYQKLVDGAVVGWLSRSAPVWGNAVQSARRGVFPGFGHRRRQNLTKRQIAYFFASGIGLSKKTLSRGYLEQQPADLIRPYFNRTKSHFMRVLTKRVLRNLLRPSTEGRPKFVPYSTVKAPRGNRRQYSQPWWEAA